jgi:endonuclease VIII
VPEGHSLVLTARRISPVVGQHVTAGLLAGTDVTAVEAQGKHLLVHGEDGRSLHVHLGMNGRVRLTEAGAGRGRYVLRTAAGDVVIAGTSRVEVVRGVRLRLGPDLLGGSFDAGAFLRGARRLDRPVAALLLDQRVLAGIGNIVRAEVLWELRQDPFAPVAELSDRRLLELAVVARRTLRAGVARQGHLPQRVYRQTGRPCPRCAAPIAAVMQGAEAPRRLYYCPGCQTS